MIDVQLFEHDDAIIIIIMVVLCHDSSIFILIISDLGVDRGQSV